uniref:TBC1 domain family member 30 n=1 Tax=Ascaris suum TaxID=6253 RepID=F1KW87_ASCSU
MKAVARLPDGIPSYFRRKLWVILANYHIDRLGLNWEQTRRVAFNERINPDDDRLSFQIIKDLHRTGWSGISGEAERIHLKRVLLGYARFNKTIGYCQGFNVIAALVLEVTEFKEECALKVMIFLIEQVLPQGYFDQSLRALSVDMAVLRSLLHQRLPKTARHLDELQRNSECENEPPLTNVFSMHWFLTLFATCLPKSCVCRLWDALMLEGSEVLLRASLAIWAKFSKRILSTTSTDHFYTLMGTLCEKLTQMRQMEINNFMSIVYTMSEFPYPGIAELRNRFTWNVESHPSAFTQFQKQLSSMLHFADDDASDSEYTSCVNCSSDEKSLPTTRASDMAALQKRYKLLRQRQKQAAIIIQASYQQSRGCGISVAERPHKTNDGRHAADVDDTSATMFNHLYVGALLAGFGKYNAQMQPPTYNTMNGTVAVTSTIVQPVNIDTLKTAIDFSGNGQIQSGPDDMLMRYKQENGGAEAGLISFDTRTLSNNTTPQETTPSPTISRNKEAKSSLPDADYDDDEVFLTQFIKINDNLSLPRSNGQRKESAPACMLAVTARDSETRKEWTPRRSASCAADYDSCQTQRELLEEGITKEQCIVDSTNACKCAIGDLVSSDTEAALCNSIPLKLKVFVTNGDGPNIHSKRSIASVKNTNVNMAQNGPRGAPRKQTTTRKSLAVLEKLSKQPTTVRNLPHNPFPVIHKSFQEHCSDSLHQ